MSKIGSIVLGILFVSCGFVVYKYLDTNRMFMYAGTLDTTRVILSSKVATDIVSVTVEEGQFVKKDELVAKLNDEPFRIAERHINANFERCMTLSKGKAIPQSEVDKSRRDKEENDLRIKDCNIKAPFDGMVIAKFKESGEYLNIGSNVISLSDPRNVWAYFYVPYDMIRKLKIGGKVRGFLQEAPEKVFEGVIVKINEEAEFTPKNVQTREERTRLIFGVKVRFENSNLELKSGMTMETDFAQ